MAAAEPTHHQQPGGGHTEGRGGGSTFHPQRFHNNSGNQFALTEFDDEPEASCSTSFFPLDSIQLKEPPRGCKRSGHPSAHKPDSMPELLSISAAAGTTACAKANKGAQPESGAGAIVNYNSSARAFRLGSSAGSAGGDESETSPNNSATGSKVWGDSVLSTNHEAAIDCNDGGDGLGITDELLNDIEDEDSDDGMADIRRIAAFNSLKSFLEEHNLTVFIGVASRQCQGMSIDALRAKSESQIRQLFKPEKETPAEEGNISETDFSKLLKVLGEIATSTKKAAVKSTASTNPAKHSAALCLGQEGSGVDHYDNI